MMAQDDDAPEVKIEDLPGVGPATAEKLREAGFDELLSLAVMSPADVNHNGNSRSIGNSGNR